jgi:hypothetical protein
VTADITVTASFAINTYTLTYNAGANGSISGTSPQTVAYGADGTAVTAVPATGYHFVSWSDASTANPRTDTNVTADITVTASFAITTTASAGGGSITGGLSAAYAASPLTLAVNMQGNIATVKMTKDGVLSKTCLAQDAAGKHTLQLDKDTKVMLAGNVVPQLLRFSQSSVIPSAPENTVIVGLAYELNAYSSTLATTPSPVTISPPAELILSYDPEKLPQNTSEVFIANFDTEKGWLALAQAPGVVAEVGKAHGLTDHFSIFAVLAKLAEPASTPAKFETSNLSISPTQAQLNQEITVSVKVANTGGMSGEYNLELKVDGTTKSTKQVTIAAGASQTVNFTTTGDAAGKHQVEVAGLNGEFDVTKAAKPSQINWWLIGGITVIILVLVIGLIAWRRQLRRY